jgi:hypothetical protein
MKRIFTYLQLKQEKMDRPVDTVRLFTNCTHTEAEEALLKYNGNVYEAAGSLMKTPEISGSKHIPKPRDIDHGLTPEQEEMCANGRALMDKLTAVSSAAHSKIQSGQSLAAGAVQQVDQVQPSTAGDSKKTTA